MYKKKNGKRPSPEIKIHSAEIGYGDDCTCDCSNCMKNNKNKNNNDINIKTKRSRVQIRGTLGLTDDDKYIFGCDAKIDDEPIETIYSKNLKRISINKNNQKNSDDCELQGFRFESTREGALECMRPRKSSQGTQVNLLLPSSYKYDVQTNLDNKHHHFQNVNDGVTQISLPKNESRDSNNIVIITIQSNDSPKPRRSNSKVLKKTSGPKVQTKKSMSKTSDISVKGNKQKTKRFQVRNIRTRNNKSKIRSSSAQSSQDINVINNNKSSKTNLRGKVSRNSSRHRPPTPLRSNDSNSKLKSTRQPNKPSIGQTPDRSNLRKSPTRSPSPKVAPKIRDQSAKTYISPINKNPPKSIPNKLSLKNKKPSNQNMSLLGKKMTNQQNNSKKKRNSNEKNIGPKTIEERDAAKQNLIQKYTEYFRISKNNNGDDENVDNDDEVIHKMFNKIPFTDLTISRTISKQNVNKKCHCANNCGGVNKFY